MGNEITDLKEPLTAVGLRLKNGKIGQKRQFAKLDQILEKDSNCKLTLFSNEYAWADGTLLS